MKDGRRGGKRATGPRTWCQPVIAVAAIMLLSACSTSDTAEQPSTTTTSEASPADVSISGYGDFSEFDFLEIDGVDVVGRLQECLADHGFSVPTIPPGDGLDLSVIPESQTVAALAVLEACEAGLALPPPRLPTYSEAEAFLQQLIETRDCLVELGFDITDPPSVETYYESYNSGPWHPFSSIGAVSSAEFARIEKACPQPG